MDLLETIYNAGVVGAGGAGFPTHKKLVPNTEWLIINAAECEPLLNSDCYVMGNFPRDIIRGISMVKEQLNIQKAVIGVKSHNAAEVSALKKAIKEEKADISLYLMDSFYPAGDEQIMVYEITGKSIPPGGIPMAVGAVVINVTTALHIYEATCGKAVTRRFVTVTGEVNAPVILDVPVGASVAGCIAKAGGVTCDDYIFIKGGPMMGRQYTSAKAKDVFITKTDGGIIVLPSDHLLRIDNQLSLEHIFNRARSTCIQCSFCTDMCPRYLIGHKLRPHMVMRSVSTGTVPESLTDALLCCECGVCELYACPMHLSPRKVNIHIKSLLREKGIKVDSTELLTQNTKLRSSRKLPQARLIHRLALSKYPKKIHEAAVFEPSQVNISLKQSMGIASTPIVFVGDLVQAGQCIATVEKEKMGVKIHSGISGRVTEINDAIVISEVGL